MSDAIHPDEMEVQDAEPSGSLANFGGVDWRAPRFQYGPTTFTVRKLGPFAGKRAFEIIRPHMGKVLANIDEKVFSTDGSSTEAEASAAFVKTLGDILEYIPSGPLEQLQNALFERVFFTNKSSPKPLPITKNPDTAFMELEWAHIYLVFIRAAVVNFERSFSVIGSLFQASGPEKDDSSLPDIPT